MTQWFFDIARTWDGHALPQHQRAQVTLALPRSRPQLAEVTIRSPFYDDPAPAAAPGSLDGLWEHEVVELMLLGSDQAYLELEFGPHGHYLVLNLVGERNIVSKGQRLTYDAHRNEQSWWATARFPVAWLPNGLRKANAYAIHGNGEGRRYHAWQPTLGDKPDFHRLERFGSLDAARAPQ